MDAIKARILSVMAKQEAKREYEVMLPVHTRSALEDIDKRIEYTASIGQSELKVETGDYPSLNKKAFNYIKEDLKKKGFKVKFKTFKKDYGVATLVSEGLLIKW